MNHHLAAAWNRARKEGTPEAVEMAVRLSRALRGITTPITNMRLALAEELAYVDQHPEQLVVTGEGVEVGPGSVLGQIGGGAVWGASGELHKIPHIGRLVVGDHVRIGALCTIARGTVGDTIIGARTVIDDRVHIAHNCKVGEDCFVSPGAVLCGSVEVGKGCFIGVGALVKQKVKIGAGSTVGMGAVVLKDVPGGTTVVGNPARAL